MKTLKQKLSLTRYLPKDISNNIRHPKNSLKILFEDVFIAYVRKFKGSYSQHGEDIIIYKLLKNVKKGIYVDIGANCPNIISNTKYFYEKGWRGINIEPHPILFQKLLEFRKDDINLNIGIATEEAELTFYQINDTEGTAGSTFDSNTAIELEKKGYKIAEVVKRPVKPLKSVLDEYLDNRSIDFMSVDTEGFDLEVIKSNDWHKYRPTLVMVETVQNRQAIIDFMKENNYKIVFENRANTIFKDSTK